MQSSSAIRGCRRVCPVNMEWASRQVGYSAWIGVAAVTGVVAGATVIGASVGLFHSPLLGRLTLSAAQLAADRGDGDISSKARSCLNCGVVQSYREFKPPTDLGAKAKTEGVRRVEASPAPRVSGRTTMGLVGAVGGVYDGQAMARDVPVTAGGSFYRAQVLMTDGTVRSVSVAQPPTVGMKVRVINGALVTSD